MKFRTFVSNNLWSKTSERIIFLNNIISFCCGKSVPIFRSSTLSYTKLLPCSLFEVCLNLYWHDMLTFLLCYCWHSCSHSYAWSCSMRREDFILHAISLENLADLYLSLWLALLHLPLSITFFIFMLGFWRYFIYQNEALSINLSASQRISLGDFNFYHKYWLA